MTILRRHRLAIAYALLVILIAMSFYRVEALARQVEQNAVARTDLRERESILRANVLCESSNELRMEIRDFLADRTSADLNGSFEIQECPPPPADLDFVERLDQELPDEPPGDQEVRDATQTDQDE